MRIKLAVCCSIIAITLLASTSSTLAAMYYRSAEWQGDTGSWEGGYYDAAWGMPMAVVVPPTARWQTDYAWVRAARGSRGSTRVSTTVTRVPNRSTGGATTCPPRRNPATRGRWATTTSAVRGGRRHSDLTTSGGVGPGLN